MITVEKENDLLEEIRWLNYQCDSLRKLCDDILNGKYKVDDIDLVEIQIKSCIKQINETLQTQIPNPKNHIKCPKCGCEEFLIREYSHWNAEPSFDEIKKRWILLATDNTASGVDLIECKNCLTNDVSEDFTEKSDSEEWYVEFN